MQEGWGLWEGIVVVLLCEHGTREEKIKLKICACIGFGRRMDLVSAWVGGMHGVSECIISLHRAYSTCDAIDRIRMRIFSKIGR